jgi:archaellum component FlaC
VLKIKLEHMTKEYNRVSRELEKLQTSSDQTVESLEEAKKELFAEQRRSVEMERKHMNELRGLQQQLSKQKKQEEGSSEVNPHTFCAVFV